MRFRQARAADVPAIVALIESAYRGEASRAGWTTEADLVDGPRTDLSELGRIVASADDEFLLARESGGALVACCHLQKRADSAYFGMFAVNPLRQGRGVGDAVLAEAERVARDDWELSRMSMQVIEVRDELIYWYERRGYARTGEALPFPRDVQANKGPMVPGLRFVILEKKL
jgi:GNAT superfamily N-acetyltransferase